MKNLFVKKAITRELRGKDILVQPKYNTVTYGLKYLRYQGSQMWNQMPNGLKELDEVHIFKSQIKSWPGPLCHCGYCLQCQIARL